MTTILNRHIISRWAPGPLNRTMSLDSGLEFRRRDDARLSPGMLFDAESYSSKRADSEGGDASGSMLDTSNFSRKRRCSDSNKDFDLSKRHPRYLERLVEFVFRDIDEHTRLMSYEFSGLPQVNAKLTRRLFAQLSVIGAAVAFISSPMDPPSSDIVKTIARDFRDYSTLHGCTVSESTSSDALLCRRYASFVADDSWLLLIILSHSTIFRHAALTLYPNSWDLFTACLKQNAVSLEVFAKVRGLKTQYSVQRITNNVPSAMQLNMRRIQGRILRTKPGSVHGYVVAESMELVRHPTFEGYTQIDINSNIYKPEYYEAMKPRHWPKGKAWPSDPTLRIRGEGTCGSCGNEKMCHCDPISCPEVSNPLVEIRDFGHKGRGIRTLQRHRRGDLLAEYVGLIKPLDYDDDPVYGFIFTPYGKPDDDLGTISAKKFGNWTRFINHSCRPSTRFKEIVIGNRIRNMVVTLRDIDIFEELTINYGKDYWRECFCECGESCCKLSHRYAIDHKDSGRGHIKARVF